MNSPIIIAHRGASAYAPENTMAAYKKSIEMNAGGIEIDVHLSRDGHPVVIHDEKIDRVSNGTGWVKDMDLCQLKSYDFGSWFGAEYEDEKIPTLEEVLQLMSSWDGILNIELKSGLILYPEIEKKVMELLDKYGMLDRTILSSFNHYSLCEVKRLVKDAKIGLLYAAGLVEPWIYAKRLDAYAIHPLYYGVVPEIVHGCKRNGIAVNPYTVDNPDHIRRLAIAGVDAIITNVPDIALRVLSDLSPACD